MLPTGERNARNPARNPDNLVWDNAADKCGQRYDCVYLRELATEIRLHIHPCLPAFLPICLCVRRSVCLCSQDVPSCIDLYNGMLDMDS